MSVVGTWYDGLTVVKSTNTVVVAAGMVYVTLTFPELRKIIAILNLIATSASPNTSAHGPQMPKITGNVVGFTFQEIGAGTTLTYEGIVVGH